MKQFWSTNDFSLLQEALVNSLLHSIWLAAILVLIYMIIDQFPKSKRIFLFQFFMLKCSLLIFSFGTIFIFLNEFFYESIFSLDRENTLLQQKYISQILFPFWVIGSGFFFLKSFRSDRLLHKLKLSSSIQVPIEISNLIQQLRTKLQLSKAIDVRISDEIPSAFVMGLIYPTIILPVSWANHLSIGQTKAILIHELSHILHRDHIWNRLLLILENIFFFNPALLFLVDKIRLHREINADLFVIAQGEDRLQYSKLLLLLEQSKSVEIASLLAFSSNKDELSIRIKSLYDQPHKKFIFIRPLMILATCIISIFILLSTTTDSVSATKKFVCAIPNIEVCKHQTIRIAGKNPNKLLKTKSNKVKPKEAIINHEEIAYIESNSIQSQNEIAEMNIVIENEADFIYLATEVRTIVESISNQSTIDSSSSTLLIYSNFKPMQTITTKKVMYPQSIEIN